MKKRLCLGLTLFLLLTFCGCSVIQIKPLFTATPLPSRTPTEAAVEPTESPTPTVVWFPPTNTPRPLNTPTPFPTEVFVLDQGEVLLSDDFSVPENWQTFRSSQGNAVVSNHELTLVLQDSANTITSYSTHPLLDNFYLSLDVNLSICSYYRDGYGINFRVQNSDNQYRWVFNCRGETRVEKIFQGKTYRLTDWAANGAVRVSGPQKFSIGIAADGSRLVFYAGNQPLMELNDGHISSGGFGLFAYSEGYASVSVSFSNLIVRQLP